MSTAVASDWKRYDVPPAAVRRFSVDEYHQLIEAGFFASDERFELLEGWIVQKVSRNPIHDAAVAVAQQAISAALPRGYHVRVQSAITLSDSEPEPDLVVVRGEPRDYVSHHPHASDIVLVVEVANVTLEEDRRLKARIYARAAIEQYWIINLSERVIEVRKQPGGPDDAPAFQSHADVRAEQAVAGFIDGMRALPTADLLP